MMTWNVISNGSPHGTLTLHERNAPPQVVVANRKNRRRHARLKRQHAAEIKQAAERRKEKGETDAEEESNQNQSVES